MSLMSLMSYHLNQLPTQTFATSEGGKSSIYRRSISDRGRSTEVENVIISTEG
jgi:hypothetical protein